MRSSRSGAIVLADYNGLDEADRERLGHPYAMCATKAVADTLRWVDQRIERARASGEWEVHREGQEHSGGVRVRGG